MITTFNIFIIYIIGFITSIIFWFSFGVKIGFDYDGPKNYVNHDDWDSNLEAYTAFSLFWPIDIPILLIFGFWVSLKYLINLCLKFLNHPSKQ